MSVSNRQVQRSTRLRSQRRKIGIVHTSCCSGAPKFALLTLLLATVWTLPATGQNCPAPWGNAANVYGVVALTGNGTASQGTFNQVTSQSAQVDTKAPQAIPGSCVFLAYRSQGLGKIFSNANVADKLTETTTGNTATWTASGPGDYLGAQATFNVLSPTAYSFGVGDATMGVYTNTDNPPTNEDIIWGSAASGDGGASLQNLPLPPGPVVWGTTTFDSPPFETAQGLGTINAHWKLDWLFAAAPDDDCEDCKKGDGPATGSEISPQSQILGEEVNLVGTPFFLHYASNRVPGHAGVDLFALKDALALGGWTLSVHHVMDPLLSSYCISGDCTSYAIVPKAIFFGDGSSRNDAEVQTSVSWNGNYLLTNEEGSEVYVFSSQGMHLQTLAPMTGAVIYTFAYDSGNRLISITDANGNATTIQRDASGNPISITSPFGQKTTLTVDANGFLATITDPLSHATKLTNSTTGLLTSLIDPRGKTYTYTYDAMGLLTRHADPAGGSINLARTNTSTGYSVKNTTALGRTSTYGVTFTSSSTQSNRSSSNIWPNGLIATDSKTQLSGQLTNSVALPTGTSYGDTLAPDPRWGIQAPVAGSETMTRGTLTMSITGNRTANFTAGNPFSLVSQNDTLTVNGRAYTSAFTTANRTYINTSPVGRVRTIVLDSQERISTAQLTGMALNKFIYDTRGRLSSFAEGTRKYSFTYLASGFLGSVTDPLLQKTTFTYDAAGHPLSTTLPDGRVIHDTIDPDGNATSFTSPNGSKHSLTYTPINLLASYVPPAATGSGTTTYTFNADRDLTKIKRADGQVITYGYDGAERLTALTAPTQTVNFTYSATTGNLTGASVSGGEAIAYGYNGSLRTSTQWTGTVAGTVSRTFDNNFWVASQAVAGAATIAFTHDNDGFITKAGALAVRRAATTGFVTGTTLGTTTDARVTSTFAELTSYTAKAGTNTLYSSAYTRDTLGRVVTNAETIGGVTTTYGYSYDKAGRLTGVTTNGATTSAYTYDNNSNRLSAVTSAGTVSGSYDAQDRLQTYGSASYAYTSDGELASKSAGSQVTTYQYDVFGNLVAVTLPNSTKITYIVDGENNRVGKEVNGVLTTGLLYDGADLVALLNASNQVAERFVYSGTSNTPDYMIKGGVNYRIFSDQIGSPRLVVNASTGAILERIDYDEFGNVVNDTNPGFQPFGFGGGLYDQDTKLVRLGARDYDPSTGRWTTKDPTLFSGGDPNLYAYVSNDPVNRTDPSGNGDASDVGMAVLEAYFTATGQGDFYSWGKTICKTLANAQDVGLTEAVKKTAYDKATKNMNKPREEYSTGVKEAVKSSKDAGNMGRVDQRVANKLNDAFLNQDSSTKPKPCPCKTEPSTFVPDPKDQQNLKEHFQDAEKKNKDQNLY